MRNRLSTRAFGQFSGRAPMSTWSLGPSRTSTSTESLEYEYSKIGTSAVLEYESVLKYETALY